MTCVPAPSCRAALHEASLMFPGRRTASDGICASAQHTRQNPTSDHETGDAYDLTHDPASGCDVDALFDLLVRRRDPRVKYLIRSRRILRSYDKPGIPAWTWAPYSGSNPHDKHGHCSILPNARHNVAAWFTPGPPPLSQEDDMTREEHDHLVYAKDQAEAARYLAQVANDKLDKLAEAVAELARKVDG